MLGPIVAGYERYVITSGSMTGTYDTGSVVYARNVPTADLGVGDVITYAPPAGASPTALVTHRIAAITRGPRGQRVFRTKGDANPAVDPWRFELRDARQARAAFAVPYAGYVFIALADRSLRMLIIGGPALLIALSVLVGMIREARADSRAARATPPLPPPPRRRSGSGCEPPPRPRLLLGLGILASGAGPLSGAAYTAKTVNRATALTAAADWVAPAVAITAPAGALRGAVTLAATAADGGSGIAGVRIQRSTAGQATWSDICSDSAAPFACALDSTTLADGRYDLRAIALDQAGNTATSAVVANVLVDNHAPTVTLDDPGAYLRATVTLTATASDGGGAGIATVRLQRSLADADSWSDICTDASAPYTCSLGTTALTNGEAYDLRAIATDGAGNTHTSDIVVGRDRQCRTGDHDGQPRRDAERHGHARHDADRRRLGHRGRHDPALAGRAEQLDQRLRRRRRALELSLRHGDGGRWPLRLPRDRGRRRRQHDHLGHGDAAPRRQHHRQHDLGRGPRPVPPRHGDADGERQRAGRCRRGALPAIEGGDRDWTDICTDATSPYICAFDTTTTATPDGLYDLRAIMISNLGAATTSATVINRAIDNTLVRGLDVQSANKTAGTAGRLETGDTLTLTYSEAMKPATLIAGWTGTGAATLTVRLTDAANAETITLLNAAGTAATGLGTVTPGGNLIRKNRTTTFAATAILASSPTGGSVLTITLGAASGTGLRTQSAALALRWTPSAAATDLAGNASSAATVTESGPLDRDF